MIFFLAIAMFSHEHLIQAQAFGEKSNELLLARELRRRSADASFCRTAHTHHQHFCHHEQFQGTRFQASTILRGIILVDAEIQQCQGHNAQACFDEERVVKNMTGIGWCTIPDISLEGLPMMLWGRC